MKLIDEKGRLFGKVNLIDLCIVLIVIAGVAAVAMKLFGNDIRRLEHIDSARKTAR